VSHMAELWARYKRWKVLRKQRTFCYCPECRNELCGDEKTECYEGGSFVIYFCGKCHAESTWDFDAPVPLLLSWILENGTRLERSAPSEREADKEK
jgi:hypothetical protein